MDEKEVKGKKKINNSKENVKKKTTTKNKKKSNKKNNSSLYISIIAIIIAIIAIFVVLNKKEDITTISDYSTLSASKYSNELLEKYQTEESKNKFLEDYDLVQGAVGVYIIDNSTSEEDSFTKLISQLKDILKNNQFEKLSIEKPSFWNGSWQINDEGIVSFEFGSKDITPKWVNDEELINKIVGK